MRLGSTAQYSAAVSNANTAVNWSVNGTAGGSAAAGTITSTGLYTPPASLPANPSVTIMAVSQASSKACAAMTVSLLNPVPTVSSATIVGAPQSYSVTVSGSGFAASSQIEINGAAVTTTFVSPTALFASVPLPGGTTQVTLAVANPDPGGSVSPAISAAVQATATTLRAASRLLDQATFGPTSSDIATVSQEGLAAYLAQQFATPPTLLPLIPTPAPTGCASNVALCLQSEWWQAALTAPDQLRQRVALALSEIFVVAEGAVDPHAVVAYQNVLATDAFGNFLNLLHDVTVSPAMGAYLNMLNSGKPPAGSIANENFAREAMQLFTTGPNLLNADGSAQLGLGGAPLPTYTEDEVEAFARAYTGWTYATAGGGTPTQFPNSTPNYTVPMVAVEAYHDANPKTLLDGAVLPAGQSAEQDLAGSLQNIFNHPNVGPFLSKQLIQHLVTSHPSPEYVARVAGVFANDGTGVRGNMQAVLYAVLMDQEARAADDDPTVDGGHLREPILWITGVMRGLGFTNNDAVAGKDVVQNASYSSIAGYASLLSEMPYASPSVSNFFPPSYVVPGTSLLGPEFGLENTASVQMRLSMADGFVMNEIPGFTVDLSATSTLGSLASNSPSALVSALAILFMHNYMPADMQAAILSNISSLSDPAEQTRVAVDLVLTSSEYKIEH